MRGRAGPRNLRVADFDFALPEGAIAQAPAEPREAARLLHVAERLTDLHVADLPDLLGPQDLLVLNDTAVRWRSRSP
jgi:S-adenosylmethionine:tRNA ribosyltransferase-isomerase